MRGGGSRQLPKSVIRVKMMMMRRPFERKRQQDLSSSIFPALFDVSCVPTATTTTAMAASRGSRISGSYRLLARTMDRTVEF